MKLWRERNVQASPAETTRSRAAARRKTRDADQSKKKRWAQHSRAATQEPPSDLQQGPPHPPARTTADPCRPPWEAMSAPSTGPRATQSPGSFGRFSAPVAAIGYGASATPRPPLERVYGVRLGPPGHSAGCLEITSSPM
ncbi:hypothetical protein BGZ61DRAFT_471545 [Ilyonectria robusta]|uniref:uncharacterized protein n=1 Tax=Ilyonectria robusta TaxID=1079257 RepID=UPI001E8CF4DD|nr:uncharacterized protein BGZ61DRAFT_471545 [Ilyonectria robusta]KAH8738196.1 hypothetical protein BGZ61DRAFT_471545 [Ilyonectria robusta]